MSDAERKNAAAVLQALERTAALLATTQEMVHAQNAKISTLDARVHALENESRLRLARTVGSGPTAR